MEEIQPENFKKDDNIIEAQNQNSENFEEMLSKCESQKAEYLAGWQRARADFLNYKKEEMERIGALLKYANEECILKIIPIVDNFEKAEKEAINCNYLEKDGKEIIDGFLKIKSLLDEFLKSQNIEEIKSLGEKLDLNLHESVGEVEGKETESGIIMEVIQKGYKINGMVLRPSRVKISK